ncbi:hypothetical protein Hypma_008319 [Hypsizygus marmoreus]|uniref:CCHC-type domain-containing protein n=1 Tax=Hypsizygus marmoreus TaxID=39966 RepID=A0A369JVE8_HYPMA|nr:hypothetical protein Hypma_008319 [Hypsizygus marmoreus]
MYERLLSLGCSRIALVNAFNQRSDRAAGEIYQWLDEGNKIHVDAIRDNPAEMWKKLKSRLVQHPQEGRRIPDGSCHPCRGLYAHVKALRPIPTSTSPTPYTIDTLDEELTIMAMIRALPREETPFSKRLALRKPRRGAEEDAQIEAAAAAAAAAHVMACYICDGAHAMRDCPQYAAVRNLGKAKGGPNTKLEKGTGRRGGRGSGRGANSAKTDTKVEEGCDGPAAKADAAVYSGASAHMTPHREWFTKDYKLISRSPKAPPPRGPHRSPPQHTQIEILNVQPQDNHASTAIHHSPPTIRIDIVRATLPVALDLQDSHSSRAALPNASTFSNLKNGLVSLDIKCSSHVPAGHSHGYQ